MEPCLQAPGAGCCASAACGRRRSRWPGTCGAISGNLASSRAISAAQAYVLLVKHVRGMPWRPPPSGHRQAERSVEASAAPDCALPMSARTAAAADPAAGVSLEDRTLQTRKTYPCVRASAREDRDSAVSPTNGISEFTGPHRHLN